MRRIAVMLLAGALGSGLAGCSNDMPRLGDSGVRTCLGTDDLESLDEPPSGVVGAPIYGHPSRDITLTGVVSSGAQNFADLTFTVDTETYGEGVSVEGFEIPAGEVAYLSVHVAAADPRVESVVADIGVTATTGLTTTTIGVIDEVKISPFGCDFDID